jgi:hypothetical protein
MSHILEGFIQTPCAGTLRNKARGEMHFREVMLLQEALVFDMFEQGLGTIWNTTFCDLLPQGALNKYLKTCGAFQKLISDHESS